MTMRSTAMASLALALAGAAWAAPALAQSCGDDLQKLAQRREAEMATINTLIKAAKGKQLDPAVFCAKSGGLLSAENAMIAYMEKNKDWCRIPRRDARQSQGQSRQERRLRRKGLQGRRRTEEGEGAGG